MVLPLDVLPLIVQVWQAIFPFIVCEFPWEEVIFTNIFVKTYNKIPAQLCRMDAIEPSPLNIVQCKQPIVKGIKRIYNDSIREWLRTESKYYEV
jgi:hypothetical protein